MIMQGIKLWLRSLFAWWPWNRAFQDDHSQATGTLNKGTTQETIFRTTVDGPTQQNTITIAMEPIEDERISERGASTSLSAERPERIPPIVPSLLPMAEESGNENTPPHSPSEESKKAAKTSRQTTQEPSAPTTQQRLEFLRYLVQRGIVSENLNKEQDVE